MLQSGPDANATWRTIATTAALPALNGDAQTDVAIFEIGECRSGMIAVAPSEFPYNSTHRDSIVRAFGSGGRGIAQSSHKVRPAVAWRCGEQTGRGQWVLPVSSPFPFTVRGSRGRSYDRLLPSS